MKVGFWKSGPWWGQVHKWIGLIVGIQVVLWLVGGFVMTVFPIEKVRSEHNIRAVEPAAITLDELKMSNQRLVEAVDGPAPVAIRTTRILGRLYWIMEYTEGDPVVLDAATGAPLGRIPEAMALEIARADFAGEAAPEVAGWITAHNTEYRGPLPVWRIDMNDEGNTHLYISPTTGRIVARRSAVWRLYDFFWMLHIMDYKGRTNFNNLTVITASVVATLLALSGVVLLFYRFRKRDFAWLSGRS